MSAVKIPRLRKVWKKFDEFKKKPLVYLSPLLIWLIVDSINGILIREVNLPVTLSQIFKLFSLALLFPLITNKKFFKAVIGGITGIFILAVIHVFHPLSIGTSPMTVFTQDIFFGLKLISPFMFLAAFFSLIQKLPEEKLKKHLDLIFWINFGLVVFNAVLVKLGYGYSLYANRIGSKGLFVSGNELSITFITISSYLLFRNRSSSSIKLLLISAGTILTALFIGLKASVLGAIIIVGLTLLLLRHNVVSQLLNKQRIKRGYKIWAVIIGVLGAIGLLFVAKYAVSAKIVGRLRYLYKISGGSAVSAITSQRDKLAREAFAYVKNDFKWYDYLFGVGYQNISEAMSKYPPDYRYGISELDFVDLFLGYGSLAVAYYGVWTFFIVRLFQKAKDSINAFYAGVVNLILLGISLVAGHTVYSAINAPFWGIISAIGLKELEMPSIKSAGKKLLNTLKRAFNLLPFYLTITLDAVNGVLRTDINWPVSLSQMWKGLMIIFMLPLLRWKHVSKLLLLSLLFGSLALIHLGNPLTEITGKSEVLQSDAVFFLKLLTPLIFTFGLTTLRKKLGEKQFDKLALWVFIVNFAAIAINQILALKGYSDLSKMLKWGEKGQFISWNETAITYVTITSFLLYKARNTASWILIPLCIVFLIPTAMLSKRVSILGTGTFVLLTATLLRFDVFTQFRRNKKLIKRYFIWQGTFILVFGIVCLGFAKLVSASNSKLFRRGHLAKLSHPFQSAARSNFAENAGDYMQKHFTNNEFIFGIGYGNIEEAIKEYQPVRPGITEIDIIDLYLSSGTFAVLYYLFWLGYIVWLLKQYKRAPIYLYAFLMNGFLLASSLTSGHVIYSSMNAPFWALINALVFSESKVQKYAKAFKLIILGGTGSGGVGAWTKTAEEYLKSRFKEDLKIISNHGELYQNFRNSLKFIGSILKVIFLTIYNTSNPLILHINISQGNSLTRAVLTSMLLKPFKHVRIIPHIHGAKFFPYVEKLTKSKRGRKFFKSLFENPRVTAVISLTNRRKRRLKKLLKEKGINYSYPITTVYNPIEFKKLENKRKNVLKDKLELIYVGRLVEQKNVMLALKAVKRLVTDGTKNVHLNIVGDGDEREKLEKHVKKNKLTDFVTFHGWVPHEKVGGLYSKANLFVLPSKYESFGIVLLEAFANCLPAVATKVGGVPEVCVDGKNGFIVPPNSPEEMSEAIKKFIDNPKLLNTMGRTNYKRAQKFDISVIGKKLEKVYSEAAKPPKKKLLLIASSGGHLVQLMALKDWWKKYGRMFVAYNKIDSQTKLTAEKHHLTNFTSIRNPIHVFGNAFEALKVLSKYKPDLIFSTGEGLAVPYFYIGKYLFGIKTVFLDSLSKSHRPSLSAKLLYFTADELLTQSREIAKKYKRFKYKGKVI